MRFASLALTLLLTTSALAGTNANITSGVVAYQQKDYDLAIKKLNQGLEDPSIIKPKNVPKGWYYLGKSYSEQWLNTATSPSNRAQLPDNLSLAAVAYQQARSSDTSGKWTQMLDDQQTPLSINLLQTAAVEVVDAFPLIGDAKAKLLASGLAHADHAIVLQPNRHMAYDLRGQALQGQMHNKQALDSFLQALHVFEQHAPSTPDHLIGLVAVRASLLQRFPSLGLPDQDVQGDLDVALATLERGQGHMHTEWARVTDKRPVQDQYDYVMSTIETNRLDLLLQLPSHKDQAIVEFEDAIKADPTSYMKMIALAQLVESTDPKRAEEVFLQAIALRPTEHVGRYNMAAMYINRSAAVSKQANEERDNSKAHVLQQRAVDLQRKARPHLEAALASKPSDTSVLQALMQVCLYTEDLKAYAAYKKQLNALK